jgi:hypothetical protein
MFHPLPATLIDKNRKELEREFDKKIEYINY